MARGVASGRAWNVGKKDWKGAWNFEHSRRFQATGGSYSRVYAEKLNMGVFISLNIHRIGANEPKTTTKAFGAGKSTPSVPSSKEDTDPPSATRVSLIICRTLTLAFRICEFSWKNNVRDPGWHQPPCLTKLMKLRAQFLHLWNNSSFLKALSKQLPSPAFPFYSFNSEK